MKYNMFVLLILVVTAGQVVAAKPSPAEQAAADAEIRAAADSFVKSFEQRDAAAVAAHWMPDGVYVNEEGRRFAGRQAIQSEYETLFKGSSDNLTLRVEIDSIRLVDAQSAIEEGRAALTPQAPGAVRVMSRYTAIHIKQDGKWLLTDVRDTRVELPPDVGQLEDLEWLVGTWGATNKDVQLELSCRWVENRHFLARSHVVFKEGKLASRGLELIGLDLASGRITSWSFNSDGSRAVAVWAPHNKGWLTESVGVMEDGTQTSSTNVHSRKDKDTLLWESGNRVVGDTRLPDAQVVTLKRK